MIPGGQAWAAVRRRWGALALISILAYVAYHLRWILSDDHFFLSDDWAWLYQAEFYDLGSYSVLPTAIYNDRPVGALLIRFVYSMFGLNHVAHHAACLSVQLINTALVYALARRILGERPLALVAAFLFGNWAVALHAVDWVAAVFDRLGATLLLVSLNLYLSGRSRRVFSGAVFYFLAVRTKETCIVLPVLLVLYELLVARRGPVSRDWMLSLVKKQWAYWLVGAIVGGVYLWLAITRPLPFVDPTDPYYPSWSPSVLWDGLVFYLTKLLYLELLPASAVTGPVLAALCLAAALLALKRRSARVISFAFSGFLLTLLPVLSLRNSRYELYLYIPLAFFVLYLVAGARALAGRLLRRFGHGPRIAAGSIAALSLAFILVAQSSWITAKHRHFVVNKTKKFRNNLAFVTRTVPDPGPGAVFYVAGLPYYLNVFHFTDGRCFALRIVYHDDTITCRIYQPEAELEALFREDPRPNKYFFVYENRALRARTDL